MTLIAEAGRGVEHRRCGCCGRQLPAARVTELGDTPGVFICAGCALWAARRAGWRSLLPPAPVRSLMSRRARRPPGGARSAIPILPARDLDRTAAFYAAVGFNEAERYDHGYLLLHNSGVELHFARADEFTPGTCFVHVEDAVKLWKQLRHGGVAGVGPIAEKDYGLREFEVTDPDGNQVRVGSPTG